MRLTVIGLILAALPTAAARGADEPARKGPLAALQGTWKLTALEADGKASDLPEAPFWWVVKGNKIYYGGQELARATADDTTRPRCIDLAFRNPERTLEGIYAVEAGTFKVCVNRSAEGVKERPSGFSTRDKTDWRLLTFKRDKDRKTDDVAGLGGFVGLTIQVDRDSQKVVVAAVQAGSPAMKAGLKKADVLVRVGTLEVSGLPGVIKSIRQAQPNTELVLRTRRGGKEQDVTVKVGVLPFFLLD
jgi:uncharacterized protein (TIGR03067 family)